MRNLFSIIFWGDSLGCITIGLSFVADWRSECELILFIRSISWSIKLTFISQLSEVNDKQKNKE